MTSLSRALLALLLLVAAVHIWSTIVPSHDNWGFHFYAFLEGWEGLLAIAIFILLLVPATNARITGWLEGVLRSMARIPLAGIFVLLSLLLYGAIQLFRVKLHLLGDGAILLRSVPLGITGEEITASFRNQPLMFWIYRTAMSFRPGGGSPDPGNVYYLIDLAGAAIFLALLLWAMRMLPRPPVEKFLLGLLIFFGGGSQFFFGYVENYVLQYVAITAYALTGWFALERRVPILVPIALFVVISLLHLGGLVFLPSTILLVLLRWRKGIFKAGLIIAGAGAAGIVALHFAGFDVVDFSKHLQSGSVDFLRPFSAPGGNFPYAMFSVNHLIDWINSVSLVTPAGLVVAGALVMAIPREGRWNRPPLLFLLAAAGCGFFFTWVVNSALGLARDWDLFSSFFAPLLVLPVYLFSLPETAALQPRRYFLLLASGMLILHWAAWIGVNADAGRHLARMEMLDSPSYLAPTTQMVYDEALANYFFDGERYAEARTYYERFMKIDSSNTRIVGNIADVYRKLGDSRDYFRMLQRAVALGSKDAGVYSNLGVEYATQGDTMQAIALNEKAVAMNPTARKAHANLGILYSAIRDYPKAERSFQSALDLGMREPLVYRYAADVAVRLNKYETAVRYYDIYLTSSPHDERVRKLRDQLAALRRRGD